SSLGGDIGGASALTISAFCFGLFIGAENTTKGQFRVPAMSGSGRECTQDAGARRLRQLRSHEVSWSGLPTLKIFIAAARSVRLPRAEECARCARTCLRPVPGELHDVIAQRGVAAAALLILFRHPGVNALVQCGILYDVTRAPRTVVNCYELRQGRGHAPRSVGLPFSYCHSVAVTPSIHGETVAACGVGDAAVRARNSKQPSNKIAILVKATESTDYGRDTK